MSEVGEEVTETRRVPPSVDAIVDEIGVARAVQQQRVAGLIFTYRCTIACAHCLFNCSPRQPRRVMSVPQAVRYLRMLRETARVVHIAGGEAMIEYETLLAVCREAARQEARPHFVETNASWCTNDTVARERLAALADAGLRGLCISADPYHLAFVPVGRYLRCRAAAIAQFGEKNVMAGDYTRAQLREMQQVGRDPARLSEHVRRRPPNLVGRAALLAPHLPPRAVEELSGDPMWRDPSAGMSCAPEFSPATMWEIHLDPYGHLQTCCGVILGDVERTPLSALLASEFAGHPLVAALRAEGPLGLLKLAEARGYPREQYVQKCHLCWQVRQFLRPHFPSLLGPDEIYGP